MRREMQSTPTSASELPPRPLLAYNPEHHQHNGRMNENAGRVAAIVAELKRSGLWGRCEILERAPPADGAVEVLHTVRHLASLRAAYESATSKGWFCRVCTLQNDRRAERCLACGTMRAAGSAGLRDGCLARGPRAPDGSRPCKRPLPRRGATPRRLHVPVGRFGSRAGDGSRPRGRRLPRRGRFVLLLATTGDSPRRAALVPRQWIHALTN